MLELNGQKLSLAQISAVANGEDHVTLSNDARTRVEKSRSVVEKIVAEGRTVYGVNTGFGRLSDVHIPAAELRELQLNLVRSTACGVGPPLSEPETRAMLLLRANVLSHGLSGARPIVVETLLALLERGVTFPSFPKKVRLVRAAIWRRWPIWRSRSSAKVKRFIAANECRAPTRCVWPRSSQFNSKQKKGSRS